MDIDSAVNAIHGSIPPRPPGIPEKLWLKHRAGTRNILEALIASERSNFADLIDKEIAGLAKRLTKK